MVGTEKGAWHLGTWRLLTERVGLLWRRVCPQVGDPGRQTLPKWFGFSGSVATEQFGVIWSLMSCRSRSSPFPTSVSLSLTVKIEAMPQAPSATSCRAGVMPQVSLCTSIGLQKKVGCHQFVLFMEQEGWRTFNCCESDLVKETRSSYLSHGRYRSSY